MSLNTKLLAMALAKAEVSVPFGVFDPPLEAGAGGGQIDVPVHNARKAREREYFMERVAIAAREYDARAGSMSFDPADEQIVAYAFTRQLHEAQMSMFDMETHGDLHDKNEHQRAISVNWYEYKQRVERTMKALLDQMGYNERGYKKEVA